MRRRGRSVLLCDETICTGFQGVRGAFFLGVGLYILLVSCRDLGIYECWQINIFDFIASKLHNLQPRSV
jgi:hypothetical protein